MGEYILPSRMGPICYLDEEMRALEAMMDNEEKQTG